MWKLEPNKMFNSPFYYKESKKFTIQWWENFTNINWVTKVIGFIFAVVFSLLIIFIFFSIPRFVISPVLQFFMYTKLLGNGLVKFLNFFIYLAAAYLFFVYLILIMDQWFLPLVGSLIVFAIWVKIHFSNISYNRCPSCHTMYVALDEGSTYTGRSTNISWGTYDVDKGTTTTDTKIIHHYERRSKKTTETVDHYLDHRTCGLCSYDWDVDRDESEEKTKYL